ncbi:MAG TPA: hypothetical protein VHB50_14700, partial [Bryobacteraceae bacterium]|nr:hypothetical protein [Bryobacteraceae bacterium]
MKRLAALFPACSLILLSAPPGAIVSQKLDVPASMRTDVFASDRYVNIPPGFRISVWFRLPDARFLAVTPAGDVLVSQPGLGNVMMLRPDPNGGAPALFTWATGLNAPHGLAFDTIQGNTSL